MTHPDPLDQLRHELQALRGGEIRTDAPTAACLDDDAVAALAEGSLDAASRSAMLPHLAACPRCRRAVASVARALADSSVAREITAAEGGGRRRFYRVALIALPAAAALVLLLARPWTPDQGAPLHRAPTITAGAGPTLVSPVGAVADARALRWSGVPGADRYRVTLFDAGGRVLYETELADTRAALPDSIVLVPGQPYLWKVEARTGFDRWSASELIEFSIVRDSRR